MLIKNFQAKTIRDALDMVRSEFGKNAVVLKTDVVKDGAIKMFCVTAANDSGAAVQAQDAGQAVDSNSSGVTKRLSSDGVDTSGRKLESAILDVIMPDLLKGEARDYFLRLRAHDVDAELAKEICRRWQADEDPTEESLTNILSSILPAACEWPKEGTDIVFVGPCGSGKSTLLAKIATQLVFQEHQKVELATLDNFRPGAEQEINSINDIVDMVGETREEYRTREPKYRLIDTPGIGIGSSEDLGELSSQVAAIKRRFVVATLPLTFSWRQLERFLAFATSLEMDAVVFTQLDSTDSCGTILNYAAGDYPPVWGVADSRQPTDAIREFKVNTELEKLIGKIDA